MSDSIVVRINLDRYDLMSNAKHTQVYVQIPGVARASWLLDPELYHGLRLSPWPDVVDAAQTCYVESRAVTDSASAAARVAVLEWLRDDANRDEMQAAYEEDRARRDPVGRKLLARIAELEAQREALAERLLAGQTWQRGRSPELVSENLVSQSELRAIFGIPLTPPWGDAQPEMTPKVQELHDRIAAESEADERARRSVDAQFPKVAKFLRETGGAS